MEGMLEINGCLLNIVNSVDAKDLPEAPHLAAASLEKRLRRAADVESVEWHPPGFWSRQGGKLNNFALNQQRLQATHVVGVEWGIHSVAHDVQAVVRGVSEEIGGAHIVAMMCRFGADGHCWFYKAPNAQSWVLSDPSGAGSGDSSRWGGLEWSDVQAKCTGVFRTREKTLGTFKPCLFVYASGSEGFGDAHGDADARGDDERAEGRQCDDLLSHDKVHAILEKLETQIGEQEEDEGGGIVSDVLESMVSMQASHREEIASLEKELSAAKMRSAQDQARLNAALARIHALEADLGVWGCALERGGGGLEALTLTELTDYVDKAEAAGRSLRGAMSRKLQVMEQDVETGRCCVVCVTERKCAVFLPCKHLSTCAGCASSLSTCPMCRTRIEDTLLVYDS